MGSSAVACQAFGMVRGDAVVLSDPRSRRNDGKLLNGDPLPPDDARRAQIERDWKFIDG
jgi:hypothetical protein